MHYNFTDDIRITFALARSQASALGHDCVRTEHLLLGILQQPTAGVSRLLSQFNVDPDELTAVIQQRFGPSAGANVLGELPLPYVVEAKKAIERAMLEAQWRHVDQSHLFLGILSSSTEEVAGMLRERGIEMEAARSVLSASE